MLIRSIRGGIGIEFYVRFLTFWDKIRRADRYLRMPNGFFLDSCFSRYRNTAGSVVHVNPDRKNFPNFPLFEARDSY